MDNKEKLENRERIKNAKWRQRFHIEPPDGWLNDPNGLSFYKDEYHVYFQYSPIAADGHTPRGWGHYHGSDLMHMTYDRAVMMPDIPEDSHGVYSGSAIENDGVLHIFYTGNVKMIGDYDYVKAGRGANVIHVTTTDGSKMSEKQVLLRNSDYPDFCSCHVRDPKVWKEGNIWKMVLGAFPAYLMDNGYSNALVLMLMGSSLLSAALICLLYFIYKKRDGRATGKPFVFTAFREIVLILGIVTVTTYVLSDPDNIVLLPVVLLSYLLIRIFSAKSTLTIAKFVKWIAVFAVYMIMIFAFNFISYLCDGFAGKPDLSVLTDYDDVWVWVQTDEDIMTYTSSYKNPEGRKTLTKEQAEQLTDIYIKALDSREKSFSDYIDCLKNRNLAGNFASITLYTRNSDDIYSDNNSIIDVIDIDVRLTKNSTEQVAEEIKALDFISPEQISYLETKEYYD